MLPTLNIAVRVEFMARHVPSQAGNETSEDFETLFVSFTFINSLTKVTTIYRGVYGDFVLMATDQMSDTT